MKKSKLKKKIKKLNLAAEAWHSQANAERRIAANLRRERHKDEESLNNMRSEMVDTLIPKMARLTAERNRLSDLLDDTRDSLLQRAENEEERDAMKTIFDRDDSLTDAMVDADTSSGTLQERMDTLRADDGGMVIMGHKD